MSTKILPVLQMLAYGLLAVLIKAALPIADFTFFAREVFAFILALCGLVLLLSSGNLFRRHNTTVNPIHPHKASTLVTSGLYRISRNPMYLGFLSLLFGWTLYLGNAFSLLVSLVFIFTLNRFNIIPEERALQTRFGEDYSAYKKKVRRWL